MQVVIGGILQCPCLGPCPTIMLIYDTNALCVCVCVCVCVRVCHTFPNISYIGPSHSVTDIEY